MDIFNDVRSLLIPLILSICVSCLYRKDGPPNNCSKKNGGIERKVIDGYQFPEEDSSHSGHLISCIEEESLHKVGYLAIKNMRIRGDLNFTKMYCLKELSISDSEIEGEILGLDGLYNLNTLRLINVHLFDLPKLPQSLQALTIIDVPLRDIPENIMNQKSIKSLHLINNQLRSLEDSFMDMESLEELNLTHNQIGPTLSHIDLPRSVKELSVAHNLIIDVEFGFNSALMYFDASDNYLRRIPLCIENMPELLGLNLTGNPLESLDIDLLLGCKYLRNLGLARCGLANIPNAIDKLSELKQLELLSISDNGFSQEEVDTLKSRLPDTVVVSDIFEEANR